MDESNDFGSDTGSYEYTAGDMTTTYEPGYQSDEAYGDYQDSSETANELYQESTQAEIAGDSYGSAMLNDASIDASSQADESWDQYMGEGDYSPTYSTADESAGVDDGASSYDSFSSTDDTQAFDDYISS